MLTWATVYAFKILNGANGLWLIAAIAGDCYIASVIGYAIVGKFPC